jgi:hypothetical protein
METPEPLPPVGPEPEPAEPEIDPPLEPEPDPREPETPPQP